MGSITPTFTSNGTDITISPPSSSNLWQRGDLSLNNLNNFKLSIISNGNGFGIQLNNGTTLYAFTFESRWITTRTNNPTWNAQSILQLDSSTEYIIEIIVNNTNVNLKIYSIDGTELTSVSKTLSSQMNKIGLIWNKSSNHKFRELKVKAL